jgi:hypothetical protein
MDSKEVEAFKANAGTGKEQPRKYCDGNAQAPPEKNFWC